MGMAAARVGLSPAEFLYRMDWRGRCDVRGGGGELQRDSDDVWSSVPKVVVVVSFEVFGVGPERFFFGKVGRAAVERI